MATYTSHYDLAKPAVNSPVDEDLWGDELNDNMDKIDAALYAISTGGGGGTPTGAVMDYAGSTAPADWLLCYGQLVSRSTYATLFGVIGTTYGAGDGSTTFALPDCRGRLSAGKDDMGGTAANRVTTAASGIDGNTLGAAGGSQTHTLTTAQLASHSHTGTTDSAGTHVHSSNVPTVGGPGNVMSSVSRGQVAADAFLNADTTSAGAHTHPFTTATAGSGDAHNNMQPTIIFNKIIKT